MQGQLAYAGAPRGEGGQLETEEGLHAHKTVEEDKEKPSFFLCICQIQTQNWNREHGLGKNPGFARPFHGRMWKVR